MAKKIPLRRRIVPKSKTQGKLSQKVIPKRIIPRRTSTRPANTKQANSYGSHNPSQASQKSTIKKIPFKTDSETTETRIIEKVNKTIANVSKFLARWESARVKPDGMEHEVKKIRNFYEALGKWQLAALKAKASKDKDNDLSRRARINEFVHLCRSYYS